MHKLANKSSAMGFKSDIRKAITNNSGKYTVVKVWKPTFDENFAGQGRLTIEVSVRKKKLNKR